MASSVDSQPPSSLSGLCSSFDSHASTYERRLGGATRRVIDHIMTLLPPLPSNATLLDNACGPGFAAEELHRTYPAACIHAADVAPGMIELADRIVEANGWKGSVIPAVRDGMNLGYADASFDASVTNFGLFFFPDPVVGACELYRTSKPGGTAVVTCWKDVPFLPILHAMQEIAKPQSEPVVFEVLDKWTDPETVKETLREGGFEEVEIYGREVMWWNRDFTEAAGGLADNFDAMIGDKWAKAEKAGILDATMKVLQEKRKEVVFQEDGMIGYPLIVWIAVATRKNETL
ncbi:MAG: hypothetical protein Q9227_003443 [Pyrenula ochraceoflavens]